MYKMIILDLDGTLLNDEKKVSQENIDWIQKAYQEKGILSVIATGRPLGYANDIANLYHDCFAHYIIACNGAIIKDSKNNEVIHKVSFTEEEILKIRNIFLEEEADYMMLYTEEEAIAETRKKEAFEDAGISADKKKTRLGNLKDVMKNNANLIKLLSVIGGDMTTLENIRKKVNQLEGIESSVVCNHLYKAEAHTFESKYIDIVKKGCSKKKAIHILADKLGVKKGEIIVMGDGGNDRSMFECAGLKIAMENAEPYLKERADFITSSNNKNWVAKAIQRFIFQEE